MTDSPADLLVYRLLELLVVDDGPHLAVAVARPEWGHYLYWRLADILSEIRLVKVKLKSLKYYFPLLFLFSIGPG